MMLIKFLFKAIKKLIVILILILAEYHLRKMSILITSHNILLSLGTIY